MGTPNTDILMRFLNNYLALFKEKSEYIETHKERLKNIKLPIFELKPRDYLDFAEIDLNSNEPQSLVNCVSNLKRAMDCQLDTFIFVFGLHSVLGKFNMSISKKLKFIEACSLFSSRSLARLNRIRNKMEHEYEIPKIQDIEVYFDLVAAFVVIIEPLLASLYKDKTMTFDLHDEEYDNSGSFEITYDYKIPNIKVKCYVNDEKFLLETDTSKLNEFAYFFKIYLLLYQRTAITSSKYITKQVNTFFDIFN